MPPLHLAHKFVDGRIAQDCVALGDVVPVRRVELLKKPDHADWPQCLDKRINAGSPELCKSRTAAVDGLYSRFHRVTSPECRFWVGEMRRRLGVFGRSAILRLSSYLP